MSPLLADLGGRSHGHREILWIAVSGLFLAVVIGLVAAFRRQSRRAELERADSLIEEEYRRLDRIRHLSAEMGSAPTSSRESDTAPPRRGSKP